MPMVQGTLTAPPTPIRPTLCDHRWHGHLQPEVFGGTGGWSPMESSTCAT